MFEQGDLRFVVLKLISEKPSHGYEIIKAIEDRLGGAYAPSPGVIYPTLTLLEEMGAIRVQETDGPRKLYAITPEGEELLRQNQATVDAIFGRMADVNARHGGGAVAPDHPRHGELAHFAQAAALAWALERRAVGRDRQCARRSGEGGRGELRSVRRA